MYSLRKNKSTRKFSVGALIYSERDKRKEYRQQGSMGESHPAKAASVKRTGLRNCLFLKSNNRSQLTPMLFQEGAGSIPRRQQTWLY